MAARTPKPPAATVAAGKKATRQTVLRLPEDLAVHLDDLAVATGASRNSIIVEALRLAIDQPDVQWTRRATDARKTRHKH